MLDAQLVETWKENIQNARQVTVLTGAGISAESGIPTFRGAEGYWTIGSTEYHPQEMATNVMFSRMPDEVWKWYLYRRTACHNANPNPGHLALVDLEKILGDRFTLITQNVDGLHLRAGNSLQRTFQIHGNINYMRCANECSQQLYPIPEDKIPFIEGKNAPREILEKLRCPACGGKSRPHVLWFDESYDEAFFRFESSLKVAQQTDLLLVIGTSGATTLPNHIVETVLRQGGVIIEINVDESPFTPLILKQNGFFLKHPSGVILPELLAV